MHKYSDSFYYLCIPKENNEKMLRFISFGSGSSGNSYYLFTEKDGLLIDAGVGIRSLKKYFREYGFRTDNLSGILITHDHADHVKAVGKFSAEYGINVYATEEVHKGIVRNYCVTKKIPDNQRLQIKKGSTFKLGSFEITPFNVPHDSNDNVGYCIQCQGITFCLMTDVGHVTDEMKKYITKAQYLVIEANHDEEMLMKGNYPDFLKERILGENGHLSNKNCAVAIAENASPKLKHVWLCHLSEENNHPELARKTVEQVLRGYGIVPGVDFQLTILKRKQPTGVEDLV